MIRRSSARSILIQSPFPNWQFLVRLLLTCAVKGFQRIVEREWNSWSKRGAKIGDTWVNERIKCDCHSSGNETRGQSGGVEEAIVCVFSWVATLGVPSIVTFRWLLRLFLEISRLFAVAHRRPGGAPISARFVRLAHVETACVPAKREIAAFVALHTNIRATYATRLSFGFFLVLREALSAWPLDVQALNGVESDHRGSN